MRVVYVFRCFRTLNLEKQRRRIMVFPYCKTKKVVWVFFIVVEVCGVLLNFWKLPTFCYIKTDKFSKSFVFFLENYYTLKKHIFAAFQIGFFRQPTLSITHICVVLRKRCHFSKTPLLFEVVFLRYGDIGSSTSDDEWIKLWFLAQLWNLWNAFVVSISKILTWNFILSQSF